MTLPEQGGFNERLDEILDFIENYGVSASTEGFDKTASRAKAKAAIHTLIAEEIESKAERLFEWDGGQYEPVEAVPISVIKKLGEL